MDEDSLSVSMKFYDTEYHNVKSERDVNQIGRRVSAPSNSLHSLSSLIRITVRRSSAASGQ